MKSVDWLRHESGKQTLDRQFDGVTDSTKWNGTSQRIWDQSWTIVDMTLCPTLALVLLTSWAHWHIWQRPAAPPVVYSVTTCYSQQRTSRSSWTFLEFPYQGTSWPYRLSNTGVRSMRGIGCQMTWLKIHQQRIKCQNLRNGEPVIDWRL